MVGILRETGLLIQSSGNTSFLNYSREKNKFIHKINYFRCYEAVFRL